MAVPAISSVGAKIVVEDRELFEQVTLLIADIPEDLLPIPFEDRLSRHVMAAVVCKLLPLQLTFGVFGSYDHSWGVSKFGTVIDPSPIGVLPATPIMVDFSIAKGVYRRRSTQPGLDTPWVTQAIEKIIASVS